MPNTEKQQSRPIPSIPPGRDSESRIHPSYPREYEPWHAIPEDFEYLLTRVSSSYTSAVALELIKLQTKAYRKGQTFENVPAEEWQDKWNKPRVHRIATPPISAADLSIDNCSRRTVQYALAELQKIGATTRRKVGRQYQYSLLFEELKRIEKAPEPKPDCGPIAVSAKPATESTSPLANSSPLIETNPQPSIVKFELDPDQAQEFRLEFTTIGGEPTRIRVLKLGEENENAARKMLHNQAIQSIDSIAPTDPTEIAKLSTALRQLRSRVSEPLSYTTVLYPDYIQVTIFPCSKKGVMPTEPSRSQTSHDDASRPVGQAANKPDHASILAAIPQKLIDEIGPPGPLLMDRIWIDLQGAPAKNMTARVISKWKAGKFKSMGVLSALDEHGNPKGGIAKDVGDLWKASQTSQPKSIQYEGMLIGGRIPNSIWLQMDQQERQLWASLAPFQEV